MHRKWFAVIVCMCACTDEPEYPKEGWEFDADVTSTVPFRQMHSYLVLGPADTTSPVFTPGMLATDTPAPNQVLVWKGTHVRTEDFSSPVVTAHLHAIGVFGPEVDTVGVVGLDGANVVSAAVTEVAYHHVEDSYFVSDDPIELVVGAEVELWTPPSSSDGEACARFVTTPVIYFVRPGDPDCDGVVGDADCKPNAYCDPSATTAAAIVACQCP